MKSFRLALLVVSMMLVASCTVTPGPPQPAVPSRPLDIRNFFSGETTSSGVIYGPLGRETERFSAVLAGRLEGETLHLDQRFIFGDGRKLHRVWKIRRSHDGQWDVTATGIPGPIKVTESRRAIHLRYPMIIETEKTRFTVTFDQWMWLPDGHEALLLNRATISKFGVKLATVSEEFRKGKTTLKSD